MTAHCIIDTCSCICLSNSEFNQNTLLHYLHGAVKIIYSNEIHIELRDHRDKNLPAFIFDQRMRTRTLKFATEDYERRMLGKVLPSRQEKGDKGEVDNFLLSVDQIHHLKISSVVFITDDKKALRGILSEWLKSFPAISVWTSFEVVLFLYAENVIPSKDIAIEKIQDIISFTAPPVGQRTNKTAQELISLKQEYSNRINKISSLLK
jgi:hypothetical protein